jgi:hypothetical protein
VSESTQRRDLSNTGANNGNIGRAMVAGTGTFLSVPAAFKGAPRGLEHLVKFQFTAKSTSGSADEFRTEDLVSTDKVLLDFGAVSSDALDPYRLARDCEILREAALQHPSKLKKLVNIFAGNAKPTVEDVKESVRIVNQLGLSEEASSRERGGFLFFVLIAVACMAGCAHCNPYVKPTPRK